MSLLKYPLLFLLMLNGMCGFEYAKHEIHLIPENFRGEMIIYFHQPKAIKQEYEDGKLLFKINEEGHAFSPLRPNRGVRPLDTGTYYLVNEKGERRAIPHYETEGLKNPEMIVVDGPVGFKNNFHFVVDELQKIDSYPNPSFSPSQLEQWKLEQKGGKKDVGRGRGR